MSDRDETLYLEDMLEFSAKAARYADGCSAQTFFQDQMRYDAILRNLELIGEAATRVSGPVRAMAPDLPWREIIATRNRVAHGYLGIAPETVWSILQDDLPRLRRALQELLAVLRAGGDPPA